MFNLTFSHDSVITSSLISLGSWVAVQRKEFKLFMEGKPSRITQERIQRLESVGFEWVARRGHDH